MDSKVTVVAALGIFTLLVAVDLIFGKTESQTILIVKGALFLALFGALGKLMMKPSTGATVAEKELVSEAFNIKAVTYVMATPDEIAQALADPVQRQLWDPQVQSVTKSSSDNLSVTYTSPEGVAFSENLKVDMYLDKTATGSHFIAENVNGEFTRFYELQSV